MHTFAPKGRIAAGDEMDGPFPENRPGQTKSSSTPGILRGAGILVIVLFAAMATVRGLWPAEGSASATPARLAEIGITVAVGLALGGLLVGVGALLRLLREVHASLERLERLQTLAGNLRPQPTRGDEPPELAEVAERDSETLDRPVLADAAWQEIASLLRDIRDNSLLSEEERREKRLNVAEDEIHQGQELVRSLTHQGDFVRAREIADRIHRKYPDEDDAAVLVEQVETLRERQESDDVAAAGKQVNDLISISAWRRAREVAEQLQARHPDSIEARQLLLRIEREHRLFQDEQRRRMYAEVQRYVTKRRWEEALAAACTFVERFPGQDETEALRLQIPTLETNAQIERRQKLEAEIMDLTKRGRYMEAVELARKVIEKYPGSPQAEALRAQLGRLEELANNPDAPPARIRLDE